MADTCEVCGSPMAQTPYFRFPMTNMDLALVYCSNPDCDSYAPNTIMVRSDEHTPEAYVPRILTVDIVESEN